MSLAEAKKKVLEKLWEEGKPIELKDVAQKTGFKVAATNMHLLGLRKTGHVSSPQHGRYMITDLGKEALGLPKIDKAHASKILGHVPNDKAFHFYTGLHQYLGVLANSLAEFCDKVEKISVKSVEFHISRKDFEHWFRSLGDVELARRTALIQNANLHGEELRKKLLEAAKHRLEELKRLQ
jgi:hypothetical protein